MDTLTVVLLVGLILSVIVNILLFVHASVLRKMLSFFDGKLIAIEKRLLSQPKNGVANEPENGTNTETRGSTKG